MYLIAVDIIDCIDALIYIIAACPLELNILAVWNADAVCGCLSAALVGLVLIGIFAYHVTRSDICHSYA